MKDPKNRPMCFSRQEIVAVMECVMEEEEPPKMLNGHSLQMHQILQSLKHDGYIVGEMHMCGDHTNIPFAAVFYITTNGLFFLERIKQEIYEAKRTTKVIKFCVASLSNIFPFFLGIVTALLIEALKNKLGFNGS